ncbi:MAG: tetratricopeptide repeat protein [Acidobacteriota bacterium]
MSVPFPDSTRPIEAVESVEESLRALARGLARTESFGLFFAVCNSPAQGRRYIDKLREFAPDRPIETIELIKGIESILEAIVAASDQQARGPLMVLGLERSLDSTVADHPILHGLNLSRPAWPPRLARPIVFWVPEYAIGILGKEAPDFYDWQSGAYFFSEEQSSLVSADLDLSPGQIENMSSESRQRRVKELENRLTSVVWSDNPTTLSARSSWLNELGHHALVEGRLDEADVRFRASLEIAERLREPLPIAGLCSNLAAVQFGLGRYPEARLLFERAIEIEQQEGDRQALAGSLANLATLLVRAGDLEGGSGHYQRAIDLYEVLGDQRGMAMALANLAGVLRLWKRFDEAEKLLERCVELERSIGNQAGEAMAVGNLGFLALDRGDLDRAEALIRSALESEIKLGRSAGVANRLMSLGVIASRRGQLVEAGARFREALASFEQIGDPYNQAAVLSNLGVVLETSGDVGGADHAWTKAEHLFQKLGLESRADEVKAWKMALPKPLSLPTAPASAGSGCNPRAETRPGCRARRSRRGRG